MRPRILVAGPVRQKPAILCEFLRCLSEIDQADIDVDFFFVDDNELDESSALLTRFQQDNARTTIEREKSDDAYVCTATAHEWNESLIWKVARFKNRMIDAALARGSDFLFLVDSDVLVAPLLLRHLVGLQKSVVSEVFWTMWRPGSVMLPQVWVSDEYNMFEAGRGETLPKTEGIERIRQFMKRLRRPGPHRVGGLGACTLIARDALAKGLSFSEIDNLTMAGEDRHFCVRARALGVELWADTRYPPLHLYRESDLSRVGAFRARCDADYLTKPRLTLSMVVCNEGTRWLRDALRAHREFIHDAVIVDDGSTDNTVDVVREALDGVPLRLIQNPTSLFSNEIVLRKQQWEECLATNPDWLLILDADEILEKRARAVVPQLIRQTDFAVFGFQLYDFWSATHYRDDRWWCAHNASHPFLVRYTPDFNYAWRETAQHCGRMPANIFDLNNAAVDLRLKHMGWSEHNERVRKAARYKALDPDARFGVKEQYESILDPTPNLVPWQE